MALQYFLSNICKEIISELKNTNIQCDSEFILYYLQQLAFDPLWNLYPEMKEIYRMDTLRLIKFVIEKMKHQKCPCIVALKIQLYFNQNFKDRQDIVNEEMENYKSKLKPLEDEIVESEGESREALELLRKQIVYYITLWRGLGNPTNVDVYREASQAMYSVWDESKLEHFVTLSEDDKRYELNLLAQTCSGIRVFNWTCKKGGDGIENLPKLLKTSVDKILTLVQSALEATMENIYALTSVVDYSFLIVENTSPNEDEGKESYGLECHLPENVAYEDMEYIKDLLIVYRQYEVFLRKLLQTGEAIVGSIPQLDTYLEQILERFHSLAYLKVGISTDIVYPIFINLDLVWSVYQDYIIYVRTLYKTVVNLDFYLQDLAPNLHLVHDLLGNREVLSDAMRLMRYNKEETNFFYEGFRQHEIRIVNDSSAVKIELLGFCMWMMVETQGGLIPGNTNLGVFNYNGRNYTFSSLEAVFEFSNRPQHFINEVLELARKKTELIMFLQLEDQLQKVQKIKELVESEQKTEEVVSNQTATVQTVLHPVERHDGERYIWNMWDWKRQALALADISTKVTHGCQTEESGNKGTIGTQTYALKETAAQTMSDNYTNVPKPQNYLFGLRGRKDDKQFLIDLTRPVDK